MRARHSFLLLLTGLLSTASSLQAQVLYTFGTYSQNFDTLATSGANNNWTNNSTLTGWYANRTTYRASDGSGNPQDIYSYGTGTSTERALGSIAGNARSPQIFAVQLKNNTSSTTFGSITFSYTGEQWRNAGAGATNKLAFDYLKTTSSANQTTSGGYTAITSMDFNTIIAASPASALDGNLPAFQTFHTITFNISWAPGDYVWLRWTNTDLGTPNNGLAIDNFSFSSAIPEPSTYALIGIVGFFGLNWYMRRKKATATKEDEKSDNGAEESVAAVVSN